MDTDRRRLLAAGALGSAIGGTGLLGTLGSARSLAADTSTDQGAIQGVDPTADQNAGSAATLPTDTGDTGCAPLLAHAVRPLGGGETLPLCARFSNDVLLIVNTASRCGFTPQFEALETLHRRYGERGLQVLGFPSDDFRQELDDEGEIASFCRLNYGVTFPMFGKIGVTGPGAHPLYRDLAAATGGFPSWNFNKYLVDRSGEALARYEASVQPLGERLVDDIEAIL